MLKCSCDERFPLYSRFSSFADAINKTAKTQRHLLRRRWKMLMHCVKCVFARTPIQWNERPMLGQRKLKWIFPLRLWYATAFAHGRKSFVFFFFFCIRQIDFPWIYHNSDEWAMPRLLRLLRANKELNANINLMEKWWWQQFSDRIELETFGERYNGCVSAIFANQATGGMWLHWKLKGTNC